MTDLKQLLDDAAGPEPAVTDTDLRTDLTRGRRALRRRRITGIATGAVATAAVIGVAWSVLPSGSTSNTVPGPADRTTTRPTPSVHTPVRPPVDHRGLPPIPSEPVALVANTTPFPGRITCDLVPKGWAVDFTVPAVTKTDWEQKELYDPGLRNPGQYHEYTYTVRVRQVEMMDNGEGLTADKYTEAWTKLPKVRAGGKEAVISTGDSRNGLREVHVRQGRTTHLVAVFNHANNLGWDEATLLKFAGSCHYR
jgi:hypothetical protein